MIYVFAGTDRDKIQKETESLKKEFKSFDFVNFDSGSFSRETFSSISEANDLFANKYLVFLKEVFSTENLSDSLEKLKSSENIFVFIEEKLNKKEKDIFKKYTKNIFEFDKKETKGQKFNIFQITDAFSERDKKNTWVLIQKALKEGVSFEEILNILIWQTKNILISQRENSASASGLSPFVFSKAQKGSKNFSKEELQNFSRKFTSFFHESHLGLDLGPNLELFLLKNL